MKILNWKTGNGESSGVRMNIMFRLKPTYIVERVTDINLEDLKEEGIKGIIFDLDNTLMPPKTANLPEDISDWLDNVKNFFKIAIVSNNPHEIYLQKAKVKLNCPMYGKAQKPRRAVALKAIKDLDLLPSQVVIVGDRPLTDILVGQRLGIFTILVDPLIKREETAIVKFLRKLERIFIKSPHKKFTDKNSEG